MFEKLRKFVIGAVAGFALALLPSVESRADSRADSAKSGAKGRTDSGSVSGGVVPAPTVQGQELYADSALSNNSASGVPSTTPSGASVSDGLSSEAIIDRLFDQIFTDPTNLETNFLLVEMQTKLGDLEGAAATLERVLLIDPSSKLARILFAEVQFSLGDTSTAKLILQQLINEADTPDNMRRKAEKIMALIEKTQTPFTLAFGAAFSYGVAENARGASEEANILFIDLPFENTTSDENEIFAETQFTFNLSHSLTTQVPQNIGLSFLFNRRDYETYEEADLNTAQIGLDYQNDGRVVWRTGVSRSYIEVNENKYLNTLSVNGDISIPLSAQKNFSLGASINQNTYTNAPNNSEIEKRNGKSYSLSARLGSRWQQIPIWLSVNWSKNEAEQNYYASQSFLFSVQTSFTAFRWLANVRIGQRRIAYKAADVLISNRKRQDKIYNFNFTLQRILARREDNLLLLVIKAEHNIGKSNLPNYHKKTGLLSAGFSYRF